MSKEQEVSTPKKRKAKMSTSGEKKAVSKRIVRSNSAPRATKGKIPTKASSITTPKARAVRRPVTDGKTTPVLEEVEITVALPSNMSRRAVEKSLVFMQAFEREFGKSIYQIAYVTAVCFMLIGATYAASGYLQNASSLKAELITVLGDSSGDEILDPDLGDNTVMLPMPGVIDESPVTIPPSEFEFISTIPHNVTDAIPVTFRVTNFLDVKAKLVVVGKIGFIELPIENVSGDKYRVIIPKTLAANYYELRVFVKPQDGSKVYARTSDDFFIGSEDVEDWFNHQDEEEAEDSAAGATEDVVVDQNKEASDDGSTTDTSNNTEESTANESLTSNGAESVSSGNETGSAVVPALLLVSPVSTTLTGNVTLRLSAPDDVTSIELYARPVMSLNARFIALATKRLGSWVFTFDTVNIPNGEYEFFAKAKYQEKNLVSRSVRLTVKNAVVSTVTETPLAPKPDEVRELMTDVTEPFKPAVTLDEHLARETQQLINDNQSDLKTLLERYAVAKQTGDESLVKTAREALQTKREAMILSTIQNERVSDISDSLNDELIQRIEDLQNRIDTFEEIRKERSSGSTALDTDQDGISDLDEVKLYGTDPALPDTDNDGFTDGIEIMRGYDPLDPAPEVEITFESPKETVGLVRHDVLEIKEVTALLREEATDERPEVATEIRGKGLPNSFVTLYIYSTPTVVTVKTDADGTFVYTFDKELEDGKHDVYVAVTDNSGWIVAQSNPFSFIKEAQAFTPVAAAEEVIVSPQPITEDAGGGYSLAVGIGILSFGLILLMLGISLRRNGEDEIVITEKPVVNEENAA